MQSEVKVHRAGTASTFNKRVTLHAVLGWDYILNVFALLQSCFYGPIITEDAVQNWINTKEFI